jgi:hypothetical protein
MRASKVSNMSGLSKVKVLEEGIRLNIQKTVKPNEPVSSFGQLAD